MRCYPLSFSPLSLNCSVIHDIIQEHSCAGCGEFVQVFVHLNKLCSEQKADAFQVLEPTAVAMAFDFWNYLCCYLLYFFFFINILS